MPVLQMDMRQWSRYHQRLAERFQPAALKGARSAGLRAQAVMVRRTREAPPANPAGIGSGGAVNSGEFLRAWRNLPIPEGSRVLNDRPYGVFIEKGRQSWGDALVEGPARKGAGAGRLSRGRGGSRSLRGLPPLDMIARWAQRRLGLSESEAKRAAFPIAAAIRRRGLQPRQILSGDSAQAELAQILHEEVVRELDREIGRL